MMTDEGNVLGGTRAWSRQWWMDAKLKKDWRWLPSSMWDMEAAPVSESGDVELWREFFADDRPRQTADAHGPGISSTPC